MASAALADALAELSLATWLLAKSMACVSNLFRVSLVVLGVSGTFTFATTLADESSFPSVIAALVKRAFTFLIALIWSFRLSVSETAFDHAMEFL